LIDIFRMPKLKASPTNKYVERCRKDKTYGSKSIANPAQYGGFLQEAWPFNHGITEGFGSQFRGVSLLQNRMEAIR
jgi:hypothetical protein